MPWTLVPKINRSEDLMYLSMPIHFGEDWRPQKKDVHFFNLKISIFEGGGPNIRPSISMNVCPDVKFGVAYQKKPQKPSEKTIRQIIFSSKTLKMTLT